ncbi:MAG: NAD(P)/FAD-dependent oxidoreductase [Saprospiraceae bacterium]|nr:NAD(P)/FAD-dependent oxidoreductase [Saprospiraceae bacterium]
MLDKTDFEVIIVGGSYAGLSAAMALGRSLRNTLIIDANKPCNRQTPHSHNFLTQDGKTPREISQVAKEQVAEYPSIRFYDGFATAGQKIDNGFAIQTDAGDSFSAKKLIFATGITDLMPDIPGFSDCWGISVIHCPYCHGYEYHGKKTAIMANGERAFHLASLVNNLTTDLSLLTAGEADFTTEQRQKLAQHNIQIFESSVDRIEHEQGRLKEVILKDGSQLALDAVYASIPFRQHSDIPTSLGCKLTEAGHLVVDEWQKTTVEGILACGDNSTPFRSVAKAVASGNFAGAFLNMELTNESF